jgi:hypothetical protein
MTTGKPLNLDRSLLESLYLKQGLTLKVIATRLGCGPSAINRAILKFGLTRTPRNKTMPLFTQEIEIVKTKTMTIVFEAADAKAAALIVEALEDSADDGLYEEIADEGSSDGHSTDETFSMQVVLAPGAKTRGADPKPAPKGTAKTYSMINFVNDWVTDNEDE